MASIPGLRGGDGPCTNPHEHHVYTHSDNTTCNPQEDGPVRNVLRIVPALALLLALMLAGRGASAQEDHEVEVRDFAFRPATLTVRVGDTVTWTNYDKAPHNAHATDDTFRTEVVGGSADGVKSGSYTFTADDVGTHEYICDVHPDMKGTIIVEAADGQDDQQDDMPEDIGNTGGGGLAGGATFPVGSAAGGLAILLGAGYAVLRR
jgi:plastocyanin